MSTLIILIEVFWRQYIKEGLNVILRYVGLFLSKNYKKRHK